MNVVERIQQYTVTCDIDDIVGDIPCDRCEKRPATKAVKLASIHGCPYDSGRWLMCDDCASASGNCCGCGAWDSYEVIS